MKKIGLISAMAQEIRQIKEHLVIAGTENIAGYTFISGSLNGKLVILTVCGIGKVNAAICTQLLVDHFHVDCIINTGLAGRLTSDLRMCDIVISEEVTYHDIKPEQLIQCFPNRDVFFADLKLLNYAVHASDLTHTENWNYIVGKILTGDQYLVEERQKRKVQRQYNGHCFDMEAAAIAQTAYVNRIPFVLIRCISDGGTMPYETFEKIAANINGSIALQMVKLMAEY